MAKRRLVITSDLPPAAVANKPYPPFTFTASGGKKPYMWFATNVPEGMLFSSNGVLYGTPIETGSFSMTITVRDNSR